MRKAVFSMLLVFLLIGVTELLLRIAGFKPYRSPVIHINFQPSFNHLPDSLLGYALADGNFTVSSWVNTDTLVYHATHRNRQRITDTAQLKPTAENAKIILLGCSYTYGQGLDDTATCAFILQQKLWQENRRLQVENLGVGGYGPTQFYLLSGNIDSTTAKLVVINYAAFQNERTTLCRSWRKMIVPNQNNTANFATIGAPYFTAEDSTVALHYRLMTYPFLPMQKHLALVELLDNLYCQYEKRQSAKVSRRVLAQTLQQLKQKGVDVLLCGIASDEETKATVKLFKQQGYSTLWYGADIQNPRYNLMPKDLIRIMPPIKYLPTVFTAT
ncbi:hypothetical protein C7N43_21855 [Sphingobacteriales bacterium UPWRP_1]|nr:hypothetical protein BVG80_16270 [Sphingobacteriales bacterium TSM_CSM]PSJ74876.1 hypothetical protein C7N43_21855 [Sphingobacteriales bacterium UPWRP_1]